MLTFLMLVLVVLDIVLVFITQAYATQYRRALKKLKARELLAAVIVDGDEHVHMWGKWEDSTVTRDNPDGTIKHIIIQKRYCTMCNFKESVEVRSR